MRIAKFLAAAGVASRRKSEELIAQGRVTVNGNTLREPGTQVDPQEDVIAVDRKRVKLPDQLVYIMLNKPVGVVSTCTDDKGRKTVLDCITGVSARLFPVGRLDFTTEGLLLLTNDGELTQRLTHPSHQVTKRYYCVVDSQMMDDDIRQLEKGVFIEGGKTAPAKIKIMKSIPGRTELTITIHEGRNRQVRRMFEALEKNVVFLKRISEGDLNLGDLKKGQWRFLTEEEVAYLKTL